MTNDPDSMPDELLLRELRRVLDTADAVQTSGDEAAKAAFRWPTLDAELADLLFDSATDRPELVLRDARPDVRQMTFEATTAGVTIELEIGDSALIGQIVPPQAAEILLARTGDPPLVIEADEFGVFQIQEFVSGPTTVTARAADDSWSIRCSWTVP